MRAEGCLSVSTKIGRPLERFCKRGHDTHEVGRVSKGQCRACHNARQAEVRERLRCLREAAAAGVMPKEPKPKPSPEWERDRVHRWLEIIAEDPMSQRNGNTARMKEFEARYERLEVEVPTP